MSKSPSTAGVLLAAGAGTRFGMPKVLAYQGEWLRIAVRALADGGCDDIVVVLGAAASSPSGLARAVYDGRPGHPVVVAREHVPALLSTLNGDEGGRAFLASRDDVLAVECGDLATGADVDRA